MSIKDLELMIQRLTRGSVSVGDWETLAHFALDKDLVVELGTNIGTTSIMLRAMAKRVITVDIFEDIEGIVHDEEQRKAYLESFKNNQHYFSAISRKLREFDIEVHKCVSWEFAKKFTRHSVDVVLVDADHSYEGVQNDYEAWFEIIKPGGYFIFHDVFEEFPVFDFYKDVLMKDDRIELQQFEPVGISTTKVFLKRLV